MYAHTMIYEHVMLLQNFLVWENKSLTTVGEYWEVESRTAVWQMRKMILLFSLGMMNEEYLSGISSFHLSLLCRGSLTSS